MLELIPKNKYVVIEEIKSELDGKLGEGILFAPRSMATSQYKTAHVIAVSECDETKGISPGDVVLYDTLGEVSHRIGNQSVTTVKALNVLGVVREKQVLSISSQNVYEAGAARSQAATYGCGLPILGTYSEEDE